MIHSKPQKRVLLGIRYDETSESILTQRLEHLLSYPRHSEAYFLHFRSLFIALFSRKRRLLLQEASLVIPSSRTLALAHAIFFGKKLPYYKPRDVYRILLRMLAEHSWSAFIWGGNPKQAQRVQERVYRVLGVALIRVYPFPHEAQKQVFSDTIKIIHKIQPHFLLLGRGVPYFFLAQHHRYIDTRFSLYSPEIFDLLLEGSEDHQNPWLDFFVRNISTFFFSFFLAVFFRTGFLLFVFFMKIFASRSIKNADDAKDI